MSGRDRLDFLVQYKGLLLKLEQAACIVRTLIIQRIMKENMQRGSDLEMYGSASRGEGLEEDPLRLQKQEIRARINLEKEKNAMRDVRIKELKEQHLELLLKKARNEEQIGKLNRQLDDIRHMAIDPTYLQELRETFKALRKQLGNSMFMEEQDEVDPDEMTYQQLLELEQRIGKVSKGLSTQQISKITKKKFISSQNTEKKCIVCCYEFEENVEIMTLKCTHIFHEECISEWLKQEKVCPLCKVETI